ncbi:MAG: DUF3658 domain-containing protein [Bradyrhizobium sp.]
MASPISIALLAPDIIAHNRLWDLAQPLQAAERLRYRELWGQLLSENAPLRVLNGDKLASAPISFFDEMLMSLVTEHWQKVARIIGTAMGDEMDDGIIQSDDTFLATRLGALARDGKLEIRGGSARDIHVSEVRLPAAR